ncbi:VanZ family protein [Candidatus Methylacidiphilum infernorum]|uniref:VanZ family protein n=2 Tax=Candidatus Methylacidiphilum infernorum TaxID=511746 RepID=A0ABX7PVK9_9BACT|nr:VanZ family protein [Candidatus Methylacidiphilum infernorum]
MSLSFFHMQKNGGRWVFCFFYCYLILMLSSLPGATVAQITFNLSDKLLHVVAYTGLGFLFSWASTRTIQGVILTALFGALDENYQRMVPGRECDLYDWFADCFGAAVGSTAYLGLFRFFYSRKKRLPQADGINIKNR